MAARGERRAWELGELSDSVRTTVKIHATDSLAVRWTVWRCRPCSNKIAGKDFALFAPQSM